MVPGVRVTMTVARVLRLFLDEPDAPHYGLELMKATGFRSGTLYPVLARLERTGWIRSQREDIDPVTEGRPPRRYYQLTGEGQTAARYELAALAEQFHITGPVGDGIRRPFGGLA
jgi:PadR family transcriptional regulator, regulatory protein PadR